MTPNDPIIAQLQGSLQMLQGTIADLSEADFLARPVPAANHPNWQLGHLIKAETNMLTEADVKMPPLPAGFADKYTKETSASDNAANFLAKEELVALFNAARAATLAWAKTATPEQLAKPGPEAFRSFAATVADVVALQAGHVSMHVGQIQVLRRKLGKPILF